MVAVVLAPQLHKKLNGGVAEGLVAVKVVVQLPVQPLVMACIPTVRGGPVT